MNKKSVFTLIVCFSILGASVPAYKEAIYASAENVPFIEKLSKFESSLKTKSTLEIIRDINDFVNSNIEYGLDEDIYGKNDYWATPDETLSLKKGDCEDIAILKYKLLLNAGIPESSMNLRYSKLISGAHIDLAVVTDGSTYIMDSTEPRLLLESEMSNKGLLRFNRNSLKFGDHEYKSSFVSKLRDVLN